MRFRVVCGLEVTIAIFCPTSRLTKVLLPALGRPTIATNPDLCAAPVFVSRLSLMAGSHASRCPSLFESSLETLSADWLRALRIEIPASRISRRGPGLFRSHGLASPQSWLLSRPLIFQNARPASLPHRQ